MTVNAELEAIVAALSEEYTRDELEAYADEFGVELKSSYNKHAVALAFAQDGVTVELIKGLAQPTEDEEEPVVEAVAPVVEAPVVEEDNDEDLVLIKMVRKNFSYEVRGYKFTREHPFALVNEDDADYLIETEGGFAMATPKEARAYYS